MANTSFCSSACRAVINEPDCSAASTTKTPCDRPEMMRLRRGKCVGCALRRAEIHHNQTVFGNFVGQFFDCARGK